MTRIILDSRINVANAGHVLLNFLLILAHSCSFLLNRRSNENKNWRNFATSSRYIPNECDIDRQSYRRDSALFHAAGDRLPTALWS
jgi:hypothetical protein